MTAIYVNDPANGESVTLSELSRRYGISTGALSRRYRRGYRGTELVALASKEDRAKAKHAEWRAKAERQQVIIEANSAALLRPIKHIASASKMVGGKHHV
ncbi:helix-turn-helix domain-containing protein [Vreelandella olivaria]|uniref:helix-turn-helix domain-containing protein n=1 Tax=Vreelandella olivaria TaxID=390919 RepID=UPI00201EED5B|nr:helix-turn-helix domain-containing protein [Halomonas olivaria]